MLAAAGVEAAAAGVEAAAAGAAAAGAAAAGAAEGLLPPLCLHIVPTRRGVDESGIR